MGKGEDIDIEMKHAIVKILVAIDIIFERIS